MIAGGQESMSNVPFYVKREPLKYGGTMIIVSQFIEIKLVVTTRDLLKVTVYRQSDVTLASWTKYIRTSIIIQTYSI